MAPLVCSSATTGALFAGQHSPPVQVPGTVTAPDVSDREEPTAGSSSGTSVLSGLLASIEAIVFEPAGVLYDATLWWRWLLPLVARLNPGCPMECFERRWLADYLPAVQTGRRELAEALENCLAECGYSRSQIDELAVAAVSRRRELELEVRPLPGVPAALSRLRECGYRLALSCDSISPPEELGGRLARYHLEQSFEAVFSSIDLGATKSDLLAFRAMEAGLRLTGKRLLFVGCRASDLAGAAACGWATLLLGPANTPGPWPRPHVHATRLADLLREIRSPREPTRSQTST